MTTAVKYTDGVYVYYVAPDKTGKFFTFCRDTEDQFVKPSIFSPVASGSTFEAAQAALDTYARQNGKLEPCSIMDSGPEMEQETFADIPAKNEESVPPADTTPKMEQGDDSDDSADDGAEQPPQTCDWKNASGDGEKASADSESEKPVEPLPDGPDLSLRLPAFDSVFDDADAKLRDLSRAMKTKLIESGELSIKIVINNYGSILKPDPKKCKVECVPKPAKVSTQIRFPSDLEIAVEQDGRVIVPADRDQQLSFENNSASGGTVTVDGKTGVVEKYQEDGQQGQDEPPMDEQPGTNESEDEE